MICPYCESDLGDLDPIMDILSQNKLNGETEFASKCCHKKIRAYSNVGMYYIVAAEPLPASEKRKPQLIGAA
jgi:hypothetical protein